MVDRGVGGGRSYTYRYTVTTRMSRWAAMSSDESHKVGSDESHFNVS